MSPLLDVAFAHDIKLMLSGLGPPPPEVVERCHAAGIVVGAQAGTVEHAVRHKEAGVDFVIAQGRRPAATPVTSPRWSWCRRSSTQSPRCRSSRRAGSPTAARSPSGIVGFAQFFLADLTTHPVDHPVPRLAGPLQRTLPAHGLDRRPDQPARVPEHGAKTTTPRILPRSVLR